MQGSLVNGAYGALAVDKIAFPSVIVECTKGREQPENSGNFLCDADIKVYGGMDPNNTGTYIDVTAAHTILCGKVHHWITATATAKARQSGRVGS